MPFQKVKSDNSLPDSTVNNPRAHMIEPIMIADNPLLRFLRSIIHATEGSSKLIEDVNAAKPSNIKNIEPKKTPLGI